MLNDMTIEYKLTEEFIENFSDSVKWHYISGCQTLSESFIEKFENKVDWHRIFKYQKLSESFRKKHFARQYNN